MKILALVQNPVVANPPPFETDVCIAYLRRWYEGAAMYSAGSRMRDYSEVTASFSQDEYKNLVKLGRWLQDNYPVKGRYLYRSVNVDHAFYKTGARLVSKNPLSSWTTEEHRAKQFFNSVGVNSLQDNEYGCIIKCQMPESRILFNYESVTKFVDDVISSATGKFAFDATKMARNFRRDLDRSFWKDQDEYVCRTKDFPLPVEIVASIDYASAQGKYSDWYSGIGAFTDSIGSQTDFD